MDMQKCCCTAIGQKMKVESTYAWQILSYSSKLIDTPSIHCACSIIAFSSRYANTCGGFATNVMPTPLFYNYIFHINIDTEIIKIWTNSLHKLIFVHQVYYRTSRPNCTVYLKIQPTHSIYVRLSIVRS